MAGCISGDGWLTICILRRTLRYLTSSTSHVATSSRRSNALALKLNMYTRPRALKQLSGSTFSGVVALGERVDLVVKPHKFIPSQGSLGGIIVSHTESSYLLSIEWSQERC